MYNWKGKRVRIIKVVSAIVSIIGIFVVLGSIGGGDMNIIGVKQMMIQIVIGLIMLIGGAILWDIYA